MCRETLKEESVIEQIIHDAEAIVPTETTEDEFISTVSAIMDNRLDQYAWNWKISSSFFRSNLFVIVQQMYIQCPQL